MDDYDEITEPNQSMSKDFLLKSSIIYTLHCGSIPLSSTSCIVICLIIMKHYIFASPFFSFLLLSSSTLLL
jgi:hypothetical protein